LNSIDENKSIDDFNDFRFARKRSTDVYSNYLSGKRQSEPAIRFSFYNKIFDIDAGGALSRLSPTKDYRKYSLPLAMTSPPLEQPISSLMSLNEPTWNNFQQPRKSQQQHVKFRMTVNNETGDKILSGSSFESPIEDDYIDDNCVFYESDNSLMGNEFENNFIDSFTPGASSDKRKCFKHNDDDDDGDGNREDFERICKKCGHDIHKKHKSKDQIQF
jgi:hypothetical protein